MKLILGPDPNIERVETQRREDHIRRQLHKENRFKNFIEAVRWVLAQVRAVFVLLLILSVLEFIVSHRSQIQRFADVRIDQTMAKVRSAEISSPLQQSAGKHEAKADQVISK